MEKCGVLELCNFVDAFSIFCFATVGGNVLLDTVLAETSRFPRETLLCLKGSKRPPRPLIVPNFAISVAKVRCEQDMATQASLHDGMGGSQYYKNPLRFNLPSNIIRAKKKTYSI